MKTLSKKDIEILKAANEIIDRLSTYKAELFHKHHTLTGEDYDKNLKEVERINKELRKFCFETMYDNLSWCCV